MAKPSFHLSISTRATLPSKATFIYFWQIDGSHSQEHDHARKP